MARRGEYGRDANRLVWLRDVLDGVSNGVEMVEGDAVILALLQDGMPAQAGLRAFEHEHLEEVPVVVRGHAPFLVVVGEVEFIGGPRAASQLPVHSDVGDFFSGLYS